MLLIANIVISTVLWTDNFQLLYLGAQSHIIGLISTLILICVSKEITLYYISEDLSFYNVHLDSNGFCCSPCLAAPLPFISGGEKVLNFVLMVSIQEFHTRDKKKYLFRVCVCVFILSYCWYATFYFVFRS